MCQPSDKKDGWCKPSQGAKHAGVSVDTFSEWFKDGLRFIRLSSGHRLTKYVWIDEYLEQYEVQDEAKQIADDLVASMNND